METASVRCADRVDVPAAAQCLARAFYDDPVCRFVWPDDSRRAERAGRSFRRQIDALWARREVHADDDFRCVAVWARPDEWQIPTGALLKILPTWLRARVPVAALAAYIRTDALHPEEPHWYLEFLGTAPEHRGQGLGGRVIEPVLRQADEEGVAVWTWSSNRQNLAFYHRQGFEVLDELPFATGGPPIFPIRREPQA
ncbi:MAG: GNAT family N-acetyltransferase [Actinobacteria bacterium]|nr:GNAT family N-acetyltransferase [Actinomycetota bacterium]